MKLHLMAIDHFARYRGAMLVFPDDGVLVVAGKNGCGKSTVIEALAWTLWGETVRGSDPMPDGHVRVVVDDAVITRMRQGRKTELALCDASGSDLTGQTATETQGKINQRFGDWRRFTASRVFSRELLSKFGLATNKERQTLLEGILGLERFNRAEKLARAALGETQGKEREASAALGAAMAALTRSREAGAMKAPSRPVEPIQAEIDALAAKHAAAAASYEALASRCAAMSAVLDRAERRVYDKGAEAMRLGQQADALLAKGKKAAGTADGDCPVCLRPMGETDRDKIAAHYEAEAAPLRASAAALQAEVELMAADIADQREQLDTVAKKRSAASAADKGLAIKLAGLREELAVAKAAAERDSHLAEMVARDEAAVEARGEELLAAQIATKVAGAAVVALGIKGARVRMFSRALARLQSETNKVLRRLGISMAVTIESHDDKVVMSLTMGENDDSPAGYRDTSGGERTRVDVAMLLALAKIAGEDGLLVFDEIFDPLDDDGIERVVELLQEMGKTRLCLVVTHNPRLVGLFPASAVWTVTKENGQSRIAT